MKIDPHRTVAALGGGTSDVVRAGPSLRSGGGTCDVVRAGPSLRSGGGTCDVVRAGPSLRSAARRAALTLSSSLTAIWEIPTLGFRNSPWPPPRVFCVCAAGSLREAPPRNDGRGAADAGG